MACMQFRVLRVMALRAFRALWSPHDFLRSQGELVYYTANDIAQAKFVLIDNEDTFHPPPVPLL